MKILPVTPRKVSLPLSYDMNKLERKQAGGTMKPDLKALTLP